MFLLVGGDSEIGAATARTMSQRRHRGRRHDPPPQGRRAPTRPFLDLTAPLDDWHPPQGTRAACVFVAIARLAACAADPAGSAHVNVTQTLALIDRLLAQDIHVLFLSTNQVFDGSRPTCPQMRLIRPSANMAGRRPGRRPR